MLKLKAVVLVCLFAVMATGCLNSKTPTPAVVTAATALASATPSATPIPNSRKIFTTNSVTAGNFGTPAAADAICAADANKPSGGGTYKALFVDGVNRQACTTDNCGGGLSEHIDWVMTPNTIYTLSDGTTEIGTTDANGLLELPLSTAMPDAASNTSYTGQYVWTGIQFQLPDGMEQFNYYRWLTSASNCGNWTISDDSNSGGVGAIGQTNEESFDIGAPACWYTLGFYCVEQ